MSHSDVADLAARLGADAEAVCRAYLSAGRRVGRYWIVGDVRNAGKWREAATGEHGDLLDVIREALGLASVRDAGEEARRFLGLPREPVQSRQIRDRPASFVDSAGAARRLFASSRPIAGTLTEVYLRRRGIALSPGLDALRFHPRCYYREDERGPPVRLPALVAAVTDLAGRQTGAHRTWLAPDRRGKRNDAMLDTLPIGVLVFPGAGIQENLADKARKLGIPVMKIDGVA